MTEVARLIPHADAFVALVRSVLGSGATVYLDEVPDSPRYPYVVVYSDPGEHAHDSLGAQLEHVQFHPAVVVAAVSATQHRMVRNDLFKVLGADLVVPGRVCDLSTMSSNPMARDTDVPDRVVMWSRDLFLIDSWAA